MVQAMDQGAIEGAMDGACGGSESNRRSDGWCKRWITKTGNLLRNIKANVIDSCIEVIIGLPDIRSCRLIHRIPSYFDTPDPSYLDPASYQKGEHRRPRVTTSETFISSESGHYSAQDYGSL